MRWRDIRFEKPTEADGDENGRVIQLLNTGNVCKYTWKNISGCIAWMPTSELPAFNPIPDPPDGWRFVEVGEAFDDRANWYDANIKQWRAGCVLGRSEFEPTHTYIVPIEPPEPQYRPFANAAEFEPCDGKRWRFKLDPESTKRMSVVYDDQMHHGSDWQPSFAQKVFADGTPFGVRVDP